MIKVNLKKLAENPAEDKYYIGWFDERAVKKSLFDWLKDYDEVTLTPAKIGVLNAVAPWEGRADGEDV